MGARSGGGGAFRTHYGTSESIQKAFDKAYQENLKKYNDAAFAKRITISGINGWYGTDFKLPLISPVNAVLSSTNNKGEGVSVMMPF